MNINYQMMRILAQLLDNDADKLQRPLLQVQACLRLGTAFLCILLCACSHNAVFTYAVLALELIRLAFMNLTSMKKVVKETLTAVVFSLIILLPALFMHQYGTMLTVSMKVAESVLVLSILNEIISWKEMTNALRFYHMPSLFVLILDMTIRFLLILGRYSNALSEAVMLRSVGRKSWKDSHIGGILGTTFLKAQRMAQATSEAMACRCFEGTYRTYLKKHFTWQDALYLILPFALVLFFIYTERAV